MFESTLANVIAIDTEGETIHFYSSEKGSQKNIHHEAQSYRARPFDDEFFEKLRGFENYIEINMIADSLGDRLFESTKTVEDFYLQVSMLAGDKMKNLLLVIDVQNYFINDNTKDYVEIDWYCKCGITIDQLANQFE